MANTITSMSRCIASSPQVDFPKNYPLSKTTEGDGGLAHDARRFRSVVKHANAITQCACQGLHLCQQGSDCLRSATDFLVSDPLPELFEHAHRTHPLQSVCALSD